jgi:hypothetical protein
MNPPNNKAIFESDIATYWFDDEILVAISKSPKRTVELIAANVTFVKRITQGKPHPFIIYLTNSPIPDKQTREFSTQQLPHIYTAMAMISKPGLSRFIMNILFRLKPPPIPMKSFTDYEEAKQWVKQFY